MNASGVPGLLETLMPDSDLLYDPCVISTNSSPTACLNVQLQAHAHEKLEVIKASFVLGRSKELCKFVMPVNHISTRLITTINLLTTSP